MFLTRLMQTTVILINESKYYSLIEDSVQAIRATYVEVTQMMSSIAI